jgi:arabinogalactan endo-1,4-beta-galactosidase
MRVPVACAAAIASLTPARPSSAPEFRVSISVSPFAETVLKTGARFTDGSRGATTADDLQRLFIAHGANEVYARISTRQSVVHGGGDHSMDRGLARARLAAALKVPFNPEMGLFDSYGDIRCQPPPDFTDYPIALPGPWASLTIDQMTSALRAYGAAVAKQIHVTGANVRIWDLGNEVEFGVAGVTVQPMPGGCDASAGATGEYHAPDRVSPAIGEMTWEQLAGSDGAHRAAWLKAHLWPFEARLFAAVATGIRTVDPQARFSTHISGISSTMPDVAAAFFSAMKDGGFVVDEAGMSYYPTSSRTPTDRLQAFKDTVRAVNRAIGKPVFIAEFGYPSATMGGPFSWNDAVPGYPLTPAGQAQFVRDLLAWGRAEGVLSGIRPWAPDFTMPGWAAMSLFARSGLTLTAKPALDAFAQK